MEQSKLFQKNLEVWSRTCPKEAVLLPYINDSSLVSCETRQKEVNFKKKEEHHTYALHSMAGAREEAQGWFDNLNLQNVQMVCVYGVGLGYYYEAIYPWLKKNRKRSVVFLEDDLAVIRKLLETERGAKLLKDPQVQLLYFKNLQDSRVFAILYWNFARVRLTVSALHSYEKNKTSILEELKHKIAYDSAKNNALLGEYLNYGAIFYLNFYHNMLQLQDSYLGNGLFGKFDKVPAIICGAGPSLAKQLPLLRQLRDKALIFAGGSALNALNAAGLQPHFGAGTDPNPMQFKRIASNQAYEVPFFYRNRMHYKAFKLIHGPRLYITGSGGYDTSEFFEKKFKIDAEFLDEGHNVVNFCVQVANAMGCDPIIFIGMDLAYTGMQVYSPGIIEETAITDSAILEVQDPEEVAFLKPDIYGKPTYTLWKWVSESEWIGDFAREHPTLRMMNCTEGGLGFPGVSNVFFAEAAKKHLIRRFEFSNRIHGEIQNSRMPQVTHRKLVRAMKELSRSLYRSMHFLEILIEETQKMLTKLKEGQQETQQSGQSVLAETELLEEPSYKHVISIFNEAYSHMLNREIHDIHLRYRSERVRMMKKLPFGIKKYRFLHDVAHVNAELINYVLKNQPKGEASEKEDVDVPATEAGEYRFEKNQLVIKDLEMGLDIQKVFDPIRIPKERKDGLEVTPGHYLKVFYDQELKLYECYIENRGKPEGQCLLFYQDGAIKEETFYHEGKLHGPATFFSKEGQILAKSWFLNGSQEGKSWWYYPSGYVYSLQRFKGNKWHGRQEYYYEDGSLKTLMTYKHGQLVEKVLRRKEEG